MKTTLEMPDPLFRRAKAKAAQQGIPFRQFVTEAVEEKLRAQARTEAKPWLRVAGKLRHLRAENARIKRVVDREFEVIEPEDWT